MSEESLEQRLDSLVTQNPGKYEPRVVERVREFIYYVKINPEKRRPYSRILSEFGELRLYFALHEKWQDRSPKEMEESDDPEAAKFYDALSRWFRNKKITGDKRKGMMEELLSSKRNSWENLRSLEDLKKRYQSNGWD